MALAAGLAAAPRAAAQERPAAQRVLASVLASEHLGGDWGGKRGALSARGIDFDVVYTGDVMANVAGGLRRAHEVLGNLDLGLTARLQPLLGRDLGTLFVYAIHDHGDGISQHVGDLQIVDNIEAPPAFRLLEAWWQTTLPGERVSLLLGLYDVNSEFYGVDSASLFVNSSFGVGAELGNSGVNGLSTFPVTSFGARLRAEPVAGLQLQTALLDGVPGDPARPRATRVQLGDGDGAFWIGEVAWIVDGEPRSGEAQPRRHRVARGWGERSYRFKAAIGSWLYSARRPHPWRRLPDGTPRRERGHPGLYAILDARLGDVLPVPAALRGLSAFAQAGLADGDVEPFGGYVGSGLSWRGPVPGRPDDAIGLGVAAGLVGSGLREALRRAGTRPARAEVAIELTGALAVLPWLTLQADLQYVVAPGGRARTADAVVLGLRYQIRF